MFDRNNSRTQILTLHFVYVNTIQLDGLSPHRVQRREYGPYRVEISNTTIGVSCTEATLFYDLVSKELKYKWPGLRSSTR